MHLLIQARGGSVDRLFGQHHVYVDYLLGITRMAGMTPISEPMVLDTELGRNAMLILAESHASVHALRQGRVAWIDLFTCKALPCEPQEIVDFTSRAFDFRVIRFQALRRGLETFT